MKAKKSSSGTRIASDVKTAEDERAFQIRNNGPPGAEHTKVVVWLNGQGGAGKEDTAIKWAGKWKMNFPVIMRLLTDPLHDENKWSCLVERVSIDGVWYLRLVREIPMEVKKKWDKTRRPPSVTVDWNPFPETGPVGTPLRPPNDDTEDPDEHKSEDSGEYEVLV